MTDTVAVTERPTKATAPGAYTGGFMARLDKDEEEIRQLEAERSREAQPQATDEQANASGEGAEDRPLTAEEQTFKQRYANLRRVEAKLREEKKTLEQKLTEATRNQMGVPASREEVEEWMKEYPQVAGVIRALVEERAHELTQGVQERLSKVEEREVEAEISKAEAKILKAHADFEELKTSKTFHDWVEAQGAWAENIIYEDINPQAMIRLIDLYKLDHPTKKQKNAAKEETAAAASSVRTTTKVEAPAPGKGRTWRESEINKLSSAEYERLEGEIDAAFAEGRVIFDMSAAR